MTEPGELADHYRTAPAGAQTSSPHQQEILADYLTSALGGRSVGTVLDLGSGRGSNLATLARHAQRIVAADVSEEALVDAAATHPDLAGRIDAVVLPGSGLPFADGAFALSVCTEVLEHVEDLPGTGRELQRVTASGGHLIVSTPNYRNLMGAVKWWKDRRSGRSDWDPWHAHAGGFERFITSTMLRATFPECRVVMARGADYASAWGIFWPPARRRLNKYLLLRPGFKEPLKTFGMQYYLLLQKR